MAVRRQEFPYIYPDDDSQHITVSPRPGLWFGICRECGEWRPLAAFIYEPSAYLGDCINPSPIEAANEPSIECQRCSDLADAEMDEQEERDYEEYLQSRSTAIFVT
jgi:hypothetical protein